MAFAANNRRWIKLQSQVTGSTLVGRVGDSFFNRMELLGEVNTRAPVCKHCDDARQMTVPASTERRSRGG
jgi:hypothetical protein